MRPGALVDVNAAIDELMATLTSANQRCLNDGAMITEGGHYRGMGTGKRLVHAVTKARIEAAHHAKPLTFLPGNIAHQRSCGTVAGQRPALHCLPSRPQPNQQFVGNLARSGSTLDRRRQQPVFGR
jgi:hypothetical protein